MAKVPITRGVLSVPSKNITKTFQFNPSEMDDDKQINWGTLQIPGASHPAYQYGSGGERLLTFELYLDGDRGRFDRESSGDKPEQQSLSVKSEIRFYQSLLYPTNYDINSFTEVYPYIVLFTFGEYIKGMECVVKQARVRVNYWTPQLDPVRATISMILGESVLRSRTAMEVTGGVSVGDIAIGGGGMVQLEPVVITGRR
jgi:Contractile injection system tube protein